MKKEEADKFCETCDRKRKKKQNGCLRENVCKDCDKLYDCIGFCVAEKQEEMKNGC